MVQLKMPLKGSKTLVEKKGRWSDTSGIDDEELTFREYHVDPQVDKTKDPKTKEVNTNIQPKKQILTPRIRDSSSSSSSSS